MKTAFLIALAGALSASISFASAKDFSAPSGPGNPAWRMHGGAVAASSYGRAPARSVHQPSYRPAPVGRIHSVVAPQRGWVRPPSMSHRPWEPVRHVGGWRHAAAPVARFIHVPSHSRWRAASAVYAKGSGVYAIGGSYDPPLGVQPLETLAPRAVHTAAPQVIYGAYDSGYLPLRRNPIPTIYGGNGTSYCECEPVRQPQLMCQD